MAIEYDSDDIGDLDDEEGATNQGAATVDQFDNLLTEFLEQHPTQDHNHEAGYAYDTAGGTAAGEMNPVDRAAVAKVTLLLPSYLQQDILAEHLDNNEQLCVLWHLYVYGKQQQTGL